MDVYQLLPKDRQWIESRITTLGKQIQNLGPEFKEVLDQSSETWHDNAPFDTVRDKQSQLYAEYSHLKYVILNCQNVHVKPSNVVGLGCSVTVKQKEAIRTYYITGDWSHMAGQPNEAGSIVLTCRSPLAQGLLGSKIGDVTRFGTIESLEY